MVTRSQFYCPLGCKFTVVAFAWFFSTVCIWLHVTQLMSSVMMVVVVGSSSQQTMPSKELYSLPWWTTSGGGCHLYLYLYSSLYLYLAACDAADVGSGPQQQADDAQRGVVLPGLAPSMQLHPKDSQENIWTSSSFVAFSIVIHLDKF